MAFPSIAFEGHASFEEARWRTRSSQELLVLLVSGLAHALAIGAALQFLSTRPLVPARFRVVEVELVSEADVVETPPSPQTQDVEPVAPELYPAEISSDLMSPATGAPAVIAPQLSDVPEDKADEASNDGFVEAEELFTARILKENGSEEVRKTLPLLAPEERVTQLCNIEALEQVRMDRSGPEPDSLDPSSFGPTTFAEGQLEATGGAIRIAREWYHIEFECVPGEDLESIQHFRYRLGEEIPRELWEEHNLIPEDFDDD
jgi:hypothetical protein